MFVHLHVFYVDNIKYKKRNNSHFMLVDGMSTLLTESAKNCESMDFHAFGLKWWVNLLNILIYLF